MDFAMPAELQAYLDELDAFIAAEIKCTQSALRIAVPIHRVSLGTG